MREELMVMYQAGRQLAQPVEAEVFPVQPLDEYVYQGKGGLRLVVDGR